MNTEDGQSKDMIMRERGRGDVKTLHWGEIAIEQMGLSDQDDDNIYYDNACLCVCLFVCLRMFLSVQTCLFVGFSR